MQTNECQTIITNSYNSAALLEKSVFGNLTNSFSYYKNAMPALITTENGSVSNIYDHANRFVSGICIADDVETSTDYMLDYAGNTTNAFVYLDGTNIIESSAEFDEAERISSFSTVASEACHAVGTEEDDRRETNAYAFAYSEISGLTSQMTNQNSGIFVEYDFDIMNQLKSLIWKDDSGTVIKSFDYSYSISGMITNIAREASSEDVSYEYSDFFGTLWKSSSSYYTAQYVTDAVGNPFEYVINGSYFYNFGFDAGNRLSSWMGGGYKYNIAGCVTNKMSSGNSTEINWNDRYQITDVSKNGSLAKSYTYDSLGRRSSITDGSGNITKIIYAGLHMVADLDANGDVLKTYTAGPGIDNWLSFTDHQTSNTYYYITDHVGTVHAVTDSSGTVVESYRYSPYGKVLDVFDENGNTISESAIGNRILFQGREYDYDTGFYYFRARWLDPDTGRWLSKDPIGINGGFNQYVFCGNNPVMLVDPLGLCEDDGYPAFRQRHWYDSVTTYAWITGRNVVNYVGAPYVNTYHAAEAYYDNPTLIGACELAQAYLPVVIAVGLAAPGRTAVQPVNLNPFTGSVSRRVFVVNPNGNVVPVQAGQSLTGSANGIFLQVHSGGVNSPYTAMRLDGPHGKFKINHAHVPEVGEHIPVP